MRPVVPVLGWNQDSSCFQNFQVNYPFANWNLPKLFCHTTRVNKVLFGQWWGGVLPQVGSKCSEYWCGIRWRNEMAFKLRVVFSQALPW